MFTDVEQIEVLSTAPLWYLDEQNEPKILQNTYNDSEIVKYEVGGDRYREVPIIGDVILLPEIGTTLFKTQQKAAESVGMLYTTKEAQNLFLRNCREHIRSKSDIEKGDYRFIPDGLYSLGKYDQYLDENLGAFDFVYIQKDKTLKRICVIQYYDDGIEDKEGVGRILERYCSVNKVGLENHDVSGHRLVFDISCSKNRMQIKTFWLAVTGNYSTRPIMVTPVNGFVVFTDKISAEREMERMEENGEFDSLIASEQNRRLNGYNRTAVKEARKEALVHLGQTAMSYGYDFLTTHGVNVLTNNVIPAATHAVKKAKRKHNAKVRKANWKKTTLNSRM